MTPSNLSRLPVKPISEAEMVEMEALLDTIPEPFEPLDTSMLDGFICGVLIQPQRVAMADWLVYVTDAEGRQLPPGLDVSRLLDMARRRYAELDDAIGRRQWFDPWIFELEEDASPSEAVYAWVAGISMALDIFPGLMRLPSHDLMEPLATLYAHIDPDDLEDAEELLAEIETLEPPADMAEAVEGLVRSTLLLADVSRPVLSTTPHRFTKASQRGRPRR